MSKKILKNNYRLFSNPLKIVAMVAAGILIIGSLVYLGFFYNNRSARQPRPQITTADGKKVNLNPATSADKQAADSNKQAIIERDNKLNSQSSRQSTLIITGVTATEAKAYVAGVFEDGGLCSAVATKGSQTITASSQGFENVSYTQCSPLTWQTPLGAGTWSIKVIYKSSSTEASASKDIQL